MALSKSERCHGRCLHSTHYKSMKSVRYKNSMVFLLGRFGFGGVERVTVDLANALCLNGWRIGIAFFEEEPDSCLSALKEGINIIRLKFPVNGGSNVKKLRAYVDESNVDFIMNQWALPIKVTHFIRKVCKGRSIIKVSMIHTMPSLNNRIRMSKGLMKLFWVLLSRISLRLVYQLNDAFVLLSDSYKEEFERFTFLKNSKKLFTLPNPVKMMDVQSQKKEDLIIFVGRLSAEKRVDRIIDVWRKAYERLPGWKVEIVGDGTEREKLEEYSKGLPRFSFVGYQSPDDYYKRAKLILLTSDFEGFGLVLVEAMSAGCVPVVFGNYSAAYEIVTDSVGVTVSPPWKEERFEDELVFLANDKERFSKLSIAGSIAAKRYSIDNVVINYKEFLRKLKK